MLGANPKTTIPNNHLDEMNSGLLVTRIFKATPQKNTAIRIITDGITIVR